MSRPIPNPVTGFNFAEELKLLLPAEFEKRFPYPLLVVPLVRSEAGTSKAGEGIVGGYYTQSVVTKGTTQFEFGKNLFVPVRKKIDASGPTIWVGRDPTCDVVVPLATVSKVHFRILREPDGKYLIAEMGSKNGTQLNGALLVKDKPVPLNSGSRITISDANLRFLSAKQFYDEMKSGQL